MDEEMLHVAVQKVMGHQHVLLMVAVAVLRPLPSLGNKAARITNKLTGMPSPQRNCERRVLARRPRPRLAR